MSNDRERAAELKRLQSRLANSKVTLETLDGEIKERQTVADEERKTLNELQTNIHKLEQKQKRPVVTEHAMLRYCELVLGIDLDEVCKEILSDQVLEYVEKLGGSGKFPSKHAESGKQYKVVMKNRQVRTIIVKDSD